MSATLALPLPGYGVPVRRHASWESALVQWSLIGAALASLSLLLFVPLPAAFYEALLKGLHPYISPPAAPHAPAPF